MTAKMKNILRGAGSIISVTGASTRRSSGATRRVASIPKDGLAGDFQRISGDFKRAFDKIDSEKIAHG